MQPNHAFVLQTAAALCCSADSKILDYGCGSGEIVAEGVRRGLNVFGVDVFYEGNPERLNEARRRGLLGSRVFEMREGTIPFPDATFDIVVSNMVFEHVVDIGATLEEVSRVLAPGGKLLCLFPTLETVREGHCGIPCVHWFRRGSRFRAAWMYALRLAGLGYNKGHKSVRAWCRDYLAWLDAYTCYRSRRDLEREFSRRFKPPAQFEAEYLAFRLKSKAPRLERLAAVVPFRRRFFTWFCRRFASVVLVLEKR